MRVEYWRAEHERWTESRCEWTAEQVDEINRTVGWEMYRKVA